MRGALYVLLKWFCAVATLSGFAGSYDMGLLLLYGMLPVVVALGAESMGPVYRFLGFGILAGTGGAAVGAASTTERVERKRALERKNARLDSFAGLVSHDLRNPLNVATGRLQLAREKDDPSHLEAVERALERMDAIIEDVLTLTWSGRDLDPESLAIRSLGALAKTAWDQVDTAEATLRLDDPPSLRCDENRLQRLLANLFRNAIEHGGEAATVRVGELPDGFYVEDDGPGLTEENPEAIFGAGYSPGFGCSNLKAEAPHPGATERKSTRHNLVGKFQLGSVTHFLLSSNSK